jgi:hypothetical protein
MITRLAAALVVAVGVPTAESAEPSNGFERCVHYGITDVPDCERLAWQADIEIAKTNQLSETLKAQAEQQQRQQRQDAIMMPLYQELFRAPITCHTYGNTTTCY